MLTPTAMLFDNAVSFMYVGSVLALISAAVVLIAPKLWCFHFFLRLESSVSSISVLKSLTSRIKELSANRFMLVLSRPSSTPVWSFGLLDMILNHYLYLYEFFLKVLPIFLAKYRLGLSSR